MSGWLQMYPSGRLVHYDNFTEADVDIVDIAHHLSLECRYGGGIRKHYSVAEHSVLVSKHVPFEYRKEALLHDACEAYLKDIPRQFKIRPEMQWYRDLEQHYINTINAKFGIVSTPESREAISTVDRALCLTETAKLSVNPQAYREHAHHKNDPEIDAGVMGLIPADAEALFSLYFMRYFRVYT